jgi:hypothetical protein
MLATVASYAYIVQAPEYIIQMPKCIIQVPAHVPVQVQRAYLLAAPLRSFEAGVQQDTMHVFQDARNEDLRLLLLKYASQCGL